MASRLIDIRPIASLLLIGALLSGAVLCVRFLVVEPEAVAASCVAGAGGFICWLRDWAVAGFLHNAYGWTAIIAGVAATVARWRWIALIAVTAGICGAVLYTYELSGAGLLLGAMVWVRSGARQASGELQQRNGEQHTQHAPTHSA